MQCEHILEFNHFGIVFVLNLSGFRPIESFFFFGSDRGEYNKWDCCYCCKCKCANNQYVYPTNQIEKSKY